MSINKTYAVLGLGRYGKAVAEELVNNGAEVLAVDIDQNNVNNAIFMLYLLIYNIGSFGILSSFLIASIYCL